MVYDFKESRFRILSKKLKSSLRSYDFFILRAAVSLGTSFWSHRGIVAKYFLDTGKPVLNGRHFSKFNGGVDKITQTFVLSQAGIPFVPTRVIGSIDLRERYAPEFPLIVKNNIGSHGDGVNLVEDERKLTMRFTNKPPQELLLQPYIEGGYDYRIIVLGDKVLGGMKRSAPEGKVLTNYSAGGVIESFEVVDDLKELALEVARAFDLDFVGVDVIPDSDGGHRVLEINSSAEFRGFVEATGIDVAGEVVEYLLAKGESKT